MGPPHPHIFVEIYVLLYQSADPSSPANGGNHKYPTCTPDFVSAVTGASGASGTTGSLTNVAIVSSRENKTSLRRVDPRDLFEGDHTSDTSRLGRPGGTHARYTQHTRSTAKPR